MGTKKGITLVANISRGKPPALEEFIATLMMPRIAMRTAGSREGIDCSNGMTSSMIIHLSKDSTNLPKHIKQFTRTWNEGYCVQKTSMTSLSHPRTLRVIVSKQIFLIRGKMQYFIACRSMRCANDGMIERHNSYGEASRVGLDRVFDLFT